MIRCSTTGGVSGSPGQSRAVRTPVGVSVGVKRFAYGAPVTAVRSELPEAERALPDAEPDAREPLHPPVLPTVLEVAEDPARSAVAAALAVHLAQQLGLAEVVADALDVVQACLDQLRAA